MKVVVVTCSRDPENVRARALRAALKTMPGVRVVTIKNKRRSWLRYPEIIWKLWRLNRRQYPAMFVLTFRGQELLPVVLRLAQKRPVWFDEFVVPLAYANDEQHSASFASRTKQSLARRGFHRYSRWLQRCKVVIAASDEQAELSARLAHANLSSYIIMPTPTDEPHPAEVAAIARLLAPPLADVAS